LNETELIERLVRELSTSQAWPDIRAVVSHRANATLAPNELLLVLSHPNTADAAILRIVAEPYSGPSS